MPTISTYLKMMDQFSRPLQRVNNGINVAIVAMERLKRVVEAPITLKVDSSKAAEVIQQTKQRFENHGGLSAIHVAIDGSSVTQELSNIQQRLRSGLTSTAVKVALDAAPAVKEAQSAREQIGHALGAIEIPVKLDFPVQLPVTQFQAVEAAVKLDVAEAERQWATIRQKIQSEGLPSLALHLESDSVAVAIARAVERVEQAAPVVTARIALDPSAAYGGIQALSSRISAMSSTLSVTLDASGALAEVERLKQRISSGAFSAIHVILDASSVTRVFNQIQQRLRSGTERLMIDVTFNARQAVRQAQVLKTLLQRQLDGIQARIRIELPASLTVMFTNLQRLVMRFIAATRRLEGVAGNQRSAQQQIEELQERILQLQNRINASTRQGGQASAGWLSNLKSIAATYLSIQGIAGTIRVSDDYVNTLARIDLINDGLQTTAELQDKIFASARRARGSYTDMAGVIGRMGILAEEAFTSNDELVAFSELMQKSFRVGGASTMEQQAGMYQLSQAMAAGKLQGDEFRSIMENAPMLAAAIADFTGKSKGELKEMSADGTITADIIKGAMFWAADDINTKFATMPQTFGDVFNLIKNSALQSFGPVIERINKMLNSETGQKFVADIQSAVTIAAHAIDGLLTAAVNVYSFFSSNWSTISPIIMGIAGAFVAWKVATVAINTVLAIHNGITALMAAKNALATGTTFALTAAQYGLNTALLANPITWIVIAIIAFIAAIVLLVRHLIKLWNTNDEFAAWFLRAWNSILNFFDQVPIFFMKVWYGIVDGAEWMAVKTAEILETMINGAIDKINHFVDKLKSAFPKLNLDLIQHVEVAGKLGAVAEARKQARAAEISEMETAAAEKAAKREQNVVDTMENRAAKRAREAAEKEADEEFKPDEIDFNKFKPDGPVTVDKVGEVGKIKDTVDISSEDLKTMRELAEMKNIQNFVTLTPQLTFGDTHVRQDGRSVDEIIANMADRMEQELVSSARNVYG